MTVITKAMCNDAFKATAAGAAPAEDDPFRVGEDVVYLAHGVGRIESIGDEQIGGHSIRIIQISFPESNMTLRLPAGKAKAAGLRRVSSPEALEAAFAILGQPARPSKMVWAKRSQDYLARINSGEATVLAGVVRDLQAVANGTTSSGSQRTLFELAIGRLASELAASSGVDKADALERLSKALPACRDAAD